MEDGRFECDQSVLVAVHSRAAAESSSSSTVVIYKSSFDVHQIPYNVPVSSICVLAVRFKCRLMKSNSSNAEPM